MNKIKELRKEKNITVAELAKELGISQSMLTNYENGNGTPESKTARGARSKQLAGRLFAACVSLRNLQRYRICRGTDS